MGLACGHIEPIKKKDKTFDFVRNFFFISFNKYPVRS